MKSKLKIYIHEYVRYLLTPVSWLLTPAVMTHAALIAHLDQATPNGSLLTFEEWKEIASSRQGTDDYVVLIDGTKLFGTLEKLPPISYGFATLEFNPGELMTVGVANIDGAIKLQYIMRDGQNYVGAWKNGSFEFWARDPFLKHENHVVPKDIDPKIVSFIVLKNRDSRSIPTTPGLASLELNNGDHLPVAIMSNPILLTDGWVEKKLKPDDILEICFDGGLHGTILDAGGQVDLTFMYIKDKYLTVQIPRSQNMVKIPWDQVAYIQGHNGGFRHDLAVGRKAEDHSVFYDSPSMPPREIGTVWIGALDDVPDQIGNKDENLLKEASGAAAISASAIGALELLGNEEMIAIEALFKDEDEKPWHMDIAFEEMADVNEKEQNQIFTFTEQEQEELEEATLFASMENQEADPEEFNVPDIDEDFAAIADQRIHEEEEGQDGRNVLEVDLSPQDMAALDKIITDHKEKEFDFSLEDILALFEDQSEPEEETAMIMDMPEPIIIRDIQDDETKNDENKAYQDEHSAYKSAEPENHVEKHEPAENVPEEIALGDEAETEQEPDYIWKEENESQDLPHESSTLSKIEEPDDDLKEENEPVVPTKDEEPDYIWKEDGETSQNDRLADQTLKILDVIAEENSLNLQKAQEVKGADFLWDDSESDKDELSPDEAAFVDELLTDEKSNSQPLAPKENQQMAYIKEQLVSLPNDDEILLEQYAAFLPLAGAPALLLKTDPYYISLSPVSNKQYEKFLEATGKQPPVHWLGGKIPEGQENAPVVNVSYQEAEAYAAWAEQRLPNMTEWKIAKDIGVIQTKDDEHFMEWTSHPAKYNHRVVISCTSEADCQLLNENAIDFNIGFRTVKDVQN